MSEKKIAVYTAIFGGYEGLIPQPKIKGVEYHCFTDTPVKSRSWIVHEIRPPCPGDNTRSARKIKILSHEYLHDFEHSIWIDGNYCVTGDIVALVNKELAECNMAVFDHSSTAIDSRDCVYDEYQAIVDMGKRTGSFKDNPEVMKKQIERYRAEGYPAHNGLVFSAVLLRRHNTDDVIRTMKRWWNELENNSKRDQLSFNYAAWKEKLSYSSIKVDLRKNEWFYMIGIHRRNYTGKYFRFRLRRMLYLLKYSKH